MKRLMLLVTLAYGTLAGADPAAEKHLIDLAKRSAGASLSRTLTQTFGEKALAEGAAHASHGPEFLFAVRSPSKPSLFVDGTSVHGLRPVPESNFWIALTRLETGTSHAFYFLVDGKPLKRTDVRAYTPQHYQQPGVQQGRLSEKFVHTSKIYAGMKSDWWYYTSPGVEPGESAALMVWQDGQGFAARDSRSRLFTVTENLVHQNVIPPMVHLLIAPGYAGEKRMRSIEYDTVSDRYARFVLDEILPKLEKRQKIRKDAYSRAIGGQSSGGICSLTAAWLRPRAFARVLSRIGSYTAIAWRSKEMKGEDVLNVTSTPVWCERRRSAISAFGWKTVLMILKTATGVGRYRTFNSPIRSRCGSTTSALSSATPSTIRPTEIPSCPRPSAGSGAATTQPRPNKSLRWILAKRTSPIFASCA